MKRAVQQRVLEPPDHGRHIYAYCHARTNQVVYSLTRTLRSHDALKQLPDLGANNTDASLRKDLWKPLWIVSLPPGPDGLKQGLHAFKKLREYRKLHELNWEPPALLSKPYSEKEIEKLQKDLDERGGNKKETVYDIIKRRKKHMRVKMVQDQKANSVADLAAVLSEQEELGSQTLEEREEEAAKDRAKEIAEMLRLASLAADGSLQELGHEIAALEARLKSIDEARAAGVPTEDDLSRTKLKRELFSTKARHNRMEFASKAVTEAREQAPSEGEQAPASEGQHDSTDASLTSSDVAEPWHSLLPSFPSRDPSKLPKRGPLRQKFRRQTAPVFSNAGVKVKWENILDAEYAEDWPANVEHSRMGWTRYTAPHGSEVLNDAEDNSISAFKAKQWRNRPANWLPEEDAENDPELIAAAEAEKKGKTNKADAKRQRDNFVQGVRSNIVRMIREKELARREQKIEEARAERLAAGN